MPFLIFSSIAMILVASFQMFSATSAPFTARPLPASLSVRHQRLVAVWENQLIHQFGANNKGDIDITLPLEKGAHILLSPTMTGGTGKSALVAFYRDHFQMPSDTKMVPVSRTVSDSCLVDEMIFSFTHTKPMEWILPGTPHNTMLLSSH